MGTPFVPPLPSPEGSPQPRRSTRGAGGAPSWAQQPPSGGPPAQSPYSGGYVNPYMGTPFVPPMSALASPAFVPGSYFAPPAALPGSPSGGVQLGSNGLPTDFVGFGMASAAMQSPYAAPGAIPGGPPGGHPPSMSAPQSPWNAPGTAFNAFQQPLPGGPPPGGPPPPAAAAPPPWAAAPPPPAPQWNQWNPSMIAALQAQAQVQAQAQAMAQAQAAMAAAAAAAAAPPPPPVASARSRDWRDHLAEREPTDKVDPFSVGPHYGLVLTPFLVAVVKPDLQVNPFLKAGPDDDTEYLKWNMLWPSSYCSRSDDPPHKSWSRGRGEPMTFPRLTSLRIVSKTFPWMIEIKAADESIGVTCGDVIDSLDDYFHGMVKKEEFDSAPRQKKKDMTAAYHLNRSTAHGVPGGRLGEGIRRLDWLGKDTVFGGIDRNDALVAEQYGGLPATFELKCEMRYQMSEREIREQDELEGELERERENARSRASHHSHGGASRGGSISRTNSRANHRD